MTLFDKTLYLQRLLFACDKAGAPDENYDKSAAWNYRQALKESEKHVDESIEYLHIALKIRGFLPDIMEAK